MKGIRLVETNKLPLGWPNRTGNIDKCRKKNESAILIPSLIRSIREIETRKQISGPPISPRFVRGDLNYCRHKNRIRITALAFVAEQRARIQVHLFSDIARKLYQSVPRHSRPRSLVRDRQAALFVAHKLARARNRLCKINEDKSL